MPAISLHNS